MPDIQLQTELAAIQTGAAIYPLTDRAFLRITGPDATRWLNGMVTNNIKDLAPSEGNYNFLLNAQGRIQGDCTIYREPGDGEPSFLLQTDNSQLQTVSQTLDRFIIMDDVELGSAYVQDQKLLLLGPEIESLLFDLGLPLKNLARAKPGYTAAGSILFLTPANSDLPQLEAIASPAVLAQWQTCISAPVVSPATIEAHRILSATPKYGIDIRNTETARDLPQETAQTHALNFNKGCYLGQEIVERIHSRGQVHRTFTRFHLTGTLPTLPAKLEANGKPAGELTGAVQIGTDIVALGYIRREAINETLTYPGGTAAPNLIPNP